MLFDTHAHYDDERFDDDRDELLRSMRDGGVGLIVNAGSGLGESRIGLQIAEKYDFIYGAAGIHPHSASSVTEEALLEIKALLSHPKCVALGEIGLDYHYDFSPRDVQRERFRDQLEIAREAKKPVIIHEREAFGDVIDILKDYRDLSLVVHCFSGDIAAAKIILDFGWMLSFTGVITFKKNKSLEVAAYIPNDRIMIETDAPYLAPVPHRGERNDSRYTRFVCDAIAGEKGISTDEFEHITYENGIKFFGVAS